MKRRPQHLALLCILCLLIVIFNYSTIQYAKAISYVSDNFEEGMTEGWTAQSGSWNFLGGEYCISVSGVSTLDGFNFTDSIIETSLKFTDAVGFRAGIIFRYADNEHYYSFELSNQYDSLAIIKYTPQVPEYRVLIAGLEDGGYPIQRDIKYTIKVIVEGNFFSCFINGQEVLNGTDNNYNYGFVGLGARSAEVTFDDFNVSGSISQPPLTPPPNSSLTPTPSLSISPTPTISPSASPTEKPTHSTIPTYIPTPTSTPTYTPIFTPAPTSIADSTQNSTSFPTSIPEKQQDTGLLGIILSPGFFYIILAVLVVVAVALLYEKKKRSTIATKEVYT